MASTSRSQPMTDESSSTETLLWKHIAESLRVRDPSLQSLHSKTPCTKLRSMESIPEYLRRKGPSEELRSREPIPEYLRRKVPNVGLRSREYIAENLRSKAPNEELRSTEFIPENLRSKAPSVELRGMESIPEYLRRKAPSEELRERRRRCFIATTYSKNSPAVAIDESKSKRFLFAMKEGEEDEFFQSLWKNLPASRDDDDVASPTSSESFVATEPFVVEDACAGSHRNTKEIPICENCVDLNANLVLRQQQLLALDEGQVSNVQKIVTSAQEGAMVGTEGINAVAPIQEGNTEDINIVSIQGKVIDLTINNSDGLNNSVVETGARNGEQLVEIEFVPESDEKKISGGYRSANNVTRQNSTKRDGNNSEPIASCSGVNIINIEVASVSNRPIKPKIIADDASRRGSVAVQTRPTQMSVCSQTDLNVEGNVSPKRMGENTSENGKIKQKNAYTQTDTKPPYKMRKNSNPPLGQTETKEKPQRNGKPHNGPKNERVADGNVQTHRQSRNVPTEQPNGAFRPKVPYAGGERRATTEPRREITQNTCCDPRSNGQHAGNQQLHTLHEQDEHVGCTKCSRHCSSCCNVSTSSIRERPSSSNGETSSQRPSEKNTRICVSKPNNFKPRRSALIATREPLAQIPTAARQQESASQEGGRASRRRGLNDVDVARRETTTTAADNGRVEAAQVVAAVPQPRHLLLCSTCNVMANSTKVMRAHLRGARHSRVVQVAERTRRRQHGDGEETEIPNGVVGCSTRNRPNNVLTCSLTPHVEPPKVISVLQYALVNRVENIEV